jgi:hypothetical protein
MAGISTDFRHPPVNLASLRSPLQSTPLMVRAQKDGLVEFNTTTQATLSLWPTHASLSFTLSEETSTLSRLLPSTGRLDSKVSRFVDTMEEVDLRQASSSAPRSASSTSAARTRPDADAPSVVRERTRRAPFQSAHMRFHTTLYEGQGAWSSATRGRSRHPPPAASMAEHTEEQQDDTPSAVDTSPQEAPSSSISSLKQVVG